MDNALYFIFFAGAEKGGQIKNIPLKEVDCTEFAFAQRLFDSIHLWKRVEYNNSLSFSNKVTDNP